jgi:hypothetical protein
MKRLKSNSNSKILRLGIAIVAVVLIFERLNNHITGEFNTYITVILGNFIWIMITGACLIFLFRRGEHGLFGYVGICSILGVSLSEIVEYLYNNNIWMDTVIEAPNTITDYQIIIILAFVILGLGLGAME